MNHSAEANPASDPLQFLDEAVPTPPADEIGLAEAPAVEAQPAAAAPGAPRHPGRRSGIERRTAEPAPQPGGGTLTIALGAVALLGAIGLGAAPATSMLDTLSRFGINSATLALTGVVALTAGSLRRQLNALRHGLAEPRDDGTRAAVQQLLDHHAAAAERPAPIGEELQHALIALQRQDEKLNNLTKAIKMYGKPLMEISGHGTEMAGSLAQLRAAVEAGTESGKASAGRLEQSLRGLGKLSQDVTELLTAMRSAQGQLAGLVARPAATVSFEPLQQQLQRLEVGVQAVAQRLENSEVQKSLLRLEDHTHKAQDAVQQLLRGESVTRAQVALQEHFDGALRRLGDGLNQLRDGNLGGIETAVRDIQREVAGVATAVAQIQANVKNGARPAAPAAGNAPAPAPAPVQAQAATPPPAATTAAPGTPAAPADGKEGGSYATGSRSTAGKNVLGAIAKLKQMKS